MFSGLFGGGQKERDARTTDEEINAILVPLGDQVADFKDRTEVSYTHILPAVNSIGVRLLVQARFGHTLMRQTTKPGLSISTISRRI